MVHSLTLHVLLKPHLHFQQLGPFPNLSDWPLTHLGCWPTLILSCMTLVCSYYLSLHDTLDSPCLHFGLQPSTLSLASCSQISDSIPDSLVADTMGAPQLDL